MEKVILTWDKGKSQYNVRIATKEDLAKLKEIRTLVRTIKKFYYEVAKEAADEHEFIDIFIGNTCFCAWKESCKQAKMVIQLSESLGIKIDVWRYIH